MWYLLWHYVHTKCSKVHALGSCSSNLMWHSRACVFYSLALSGPPQPIHICTSRLAENTKNPTWAGISFMTWALRATSATRRLPWRLNFHGKKNVCASMIECGLKSVSKMPTPHPVSWLTEARSSPPQRCVPKITFVSMTTLMCNLPVARFNWTGQTGGASG